MTEREAILKMITENPSFVAELRGMIANGTMTPQLPDGPMMVMVAPWPGANIVGNKQGRCADCDRLIVISPSTQQMMESRGNIDHLTCPRCCRKVVEAQKGPKH
jgi:hypothetical protein